MPHLGHGGIAGRQSGIRGYDAVEPLRMLGDQPQADEAAPVLADQSDLAQVEHVEREPPKAGRGAGCGVELLDQSALVFGGVCGAGGRRDYDMASCPAVGPRGEAICRAINGLRGCGDYGVIGTDHDGSAERRRSRG